MKDIITISKHGLMSKLYKRDLYTSKDNDYLIKLVLEGKKRATTSTYDENELPVIGKQTIIVNDNGEDACIVKTLDYKILK